METTTSHHSGTLICQSCGMPMAGAELQGTDREGKKTDEYCVYCYESGEFKQPETTMEVMADLCAGFMVEEGMDEAEARRILADSLPRLKRWSTVTEI
ncbi:zinc ribbon domain-containing protein [Paenibacillus graminis]|uniref:zinc ribbon domain-containing protein n=1 Tax=Paenibacillus graminis TaxID=189425 RepID=UPI000FC306BA|nr:zinc ribbon domain-containing protein [Paenibacillus graminis]MEC0172168.1 zinc ribbon domain-containing protein [Paenibacillus graminis]